MSIMKLTPKGLDNIMDGKVEATFSEAGARGLRYDAMRVMRTPEGMAVDFMFNNEAIAGIQEMKVRVGDCLTIQGLAGTIEVTLT